MPVLYHGTTRAFAVTMAGPPGTIDVTQGGGEFGRGFYCHVSEARARTWVLNRTQQPAVLRLEVPDSDYQALNIHTKTVQQARRLTQRIRAKHQQRIYLDGCDVIEGPVNLDPRRM